MLFRYSNIIFGNAEKNIDKSQNLLEEISKVLNRGNTEDVENVDIDEAYKSLQEQTKQPFNKLEKHITHEHPGNLDDMEKVKEQTEDQNAFHKAQMLRQLNILSNKIEHYMSELQDSPQDEKSTRIIEKLNNIDSKIQKLKRFVKTEVQSNSTLSGTLVDKMMEEATQALDMAEDEINQYEVTFDNIKELVKTDNNAMEYIEGFLWKNVPNKLNEESIEKQLNTKGFGTIWFTSMDSVEEDETVGDENAYIFKAKIPAGENGSIDWDEMKKQYLGEGEGSEYSSPSAILDEIYVYPEAPIYLETVYQVNLTDEDIGELGVDEPEIEEEVLTLPANGAIVTAGTLGIVLRKAIEKFSEYQTRKDGYYKRDNNEFKVHRFYEVEEVLSTCEKCNGKCHQDKNGVEYCPTCDSVIKK